MKLYLSSYRIPNVAALEELVGKPLQEVHMALIPNAKDYFSKIPWQFKIKQFEEYLDNLAVAKTTIVDLREYDFEDELKSAFSDVDIIWVLGGNTYCLRHEMKRSGFDVVIKPLLESGIVYGGESAGALAAGSSIEGVEDADEPGFSAEYITEGLNLVSAVLLPHADNLDFKEVMIKARELHKHNDVIELKDTEAAVFTGPEYEIVEGVDGID